MLYAAVYADYPSYPTAPLLFLPFDNEFGITKLVSDWTFRVLPKSIHFFVWYSKNVFSQALIFIRYLLSCDLWKIYCHGFHKIVIRFENTEIFKTGTSTTHFSYFTYGLSGHFEANLGHFASNMNWPLEWLPFAYHGNNNGKAFRFEQRTCRNSSSSSSPDHARI